MNDPDEHTLDEARGEDPAVLDQVRQDIADGLYETWCGEPGACFCRDYPDLAVPPCNLTNVGLLTKPDVSP